MQIVSLRLVYPVSTTVYSQLLYTSSRATLKSLKFYEINANKANNVVLDTIILKFVQNMHNILENV